jgi:hypothetical protein
MQLDAPPSHSRTRSRAVIGLRAFLDALTVSVLPDPVHPSAFANLSHCFLSASSSLVPWGTLTTGSVGMSHDEFRLVRWYERRHHGGCVEQVSEYSDGTFGGSCAVPSASASIAEPLSAPGVGYKAFQTREQATEATAYQLKETGHVCDQRCDGHWTTRHADQQ